MDIIKTPPYFIIQKIVGIFAHKCRRSQLLILLFLPLLCISAFESIHALNPMGTKNLAIIEQVNPDSSIEQTIDTALIKSNNQNNIQSASEFENELARKAQSGNRKTEMDNDRFYTILAYSLSIGTVILVIALIYFFINLNDKGKRMKVLKKRMEKFSLRKASSTT
jgi:hypothetical protein